MESRNSLNRSSSTEEAEQTAPADVPNTNGPSAQLPAAEEETQTLPIRVPSNENSALVNGVLQSDIGINTLLTRLKQSVASAREFAGFLKKRSTLEEEHAQGLKKLCRTSHESARRPDNRQGSYAHNYNEVIGIHDRMADNGIQFSLLLHQMHEDLLDLTANIERGRKQWKQTGLSAEKRVQDSEALMEKAKAKYDSLAEDYDRARTGDKQSGRVFGLKGPKSAAQHEEDLHRKMQAADVDYASKVQTVRGQRQELINSQRPHAVKAIQDLIGECDSGLTLQLQKFASFNEKLLLSNGICVSPLKGQSSSSPISRSLRDVIYQIDNSQDLNTYIVSFSAKASQKPADVKYERHPTLLPSQPQTILDSRSQPTAPSSFGTNSQHGTVQGHGIAPSQGAQSVFVPPLSVGDLHHYESPQQQNYSPQAPQNTSVPQLPLSQLSSPLYPNPSSSNIAQNSDSFHSDLPSSKPVFGVSLEDLLRRDGSAIPLVVYQCLQAVDLFGLDVEGIYRLSGSSLHVSKLRDSFNVDSSEIDFRNPENFFHDVNSVAGLLKQFFRELPDPLLTHEHFQGFIEAAHIDDDITRRDSLHAIINGLPDPNYATLRALSLHLHRVQEHSHANRMNAGNLAICFGPTLMGTGPNIADAGWQVRVIETILQNTYQIFDDD